eukprot:TRINITY_DN1422_c0_g1_i2.p1 TRINITY_DN1422_c0_g1~~TRINITY_DN1422_c0_g1_i2.p1  ORF type:complete len:1717 (+),score=487.31 TRINITY_DN1422_c0_g1_i2:193-5343(+)
MHPASAADHEVITKGGGILSKASVLGDLVSVAGGALAVTTSQFNLKVMTAAWHGVVSLSSRFLSTSDELKIAATFNAQSQHLKHLLLVRPHEATEAVHEFVDLVHSDICPQNKRNWKVLPAQLWAGTLAELLVFSRVVSSEQSKEGEEKYIHKTGALYHRFPVLGEDEGIIQFSLIAKDCMVQCLIDLLKYERQLPSMLMKCLRQATVILGGVQEQAKTILKDEVITEVRKMFDVKKIEDLKKIETKVKKLMAGKDIQEQVETEEPDMFLGDVEIGDLEVIGTGVVRELALSGINEGTMVRHRAVLACLEVIESRVLDDRMLKTMNSEVLNTMRSDREREQLEKQGQVFKKAQHYLRMTLQTEAESYKKDMEGLIDEVERLLDLREVVTSKEAVQHVDGILKEAQKAVKVYARNLEGMNAIAGTTLLLTTSIFERVTGIDKQLQDMKKEVSDIHTYLQLHRKLKENIDLLQQARVESCSSDLHGCERYSYMQVEKVPKNSDDNLESFDPTEFAAHLLKPCSAGRSIVFKGSCWGAEFLSLVEEKLWSTYTNDDTQSLLPVHVFLPKMKNPTTSLVEEALEQHGFTKRNVERLQEKTRVQKAHLALILVGYSFLDKEFLLDSMREKSKLSEWGDPIILVEADTTILEYTADKLFGRNSSVCMDHVGANGPPPQGEGNLKKTCEVYRMKEMKDEAIQNIIGREEASIGAVLKCALHYRRFSTFIEVKEEQHMTFRMLRAFIRTICKEELLYYRKIDGKWEKRPFSTILTTYPNSDKSTLLMKTMLMKMVTTTMCELEEKASHKEVMCELVKHIMEKVQTHGEFTILDELHSCMKVHKVENAWSVRQLTEEMNMAFLRTCLEEYLRLPLRSLSTKHPSITDKELVKLLMDYNSRLALDMTRDHARQAPYENRCRGFLRAQRTGGHDVGKLDQQMVRDLFAASPVEVSRDQDGKKQERVYSFSSEWLQEIFTAIAVHDKLMRFPLNRICTKFFVSVFSHTYVCKDDTADQAEQDEHRWAHFRKQKDLMVRKVREAKPDFTKEKASKYLVLACKAACAREATWDVLMEDLMNYPGVLRNYLAKMVLKKKSLNSEDKLLIWFRDTLLSLVELSKLPWCDAPAAVAITILSAANDSFAGMDFRGIQIPGASLEDSTFDRTDTDGVEMKGIIRTYLHGKDKIKSSLRKGLLSFAAFTDDKGKDTVAEVYADKVLFSGKEVKLPEEIMNLKNPKILSKIVQRGKQCVLVVAYEVDGVVTIAECQQEEVSVEVVSTPMELMFIADDSKVWCVNRGEGGIVRDAKATTGAQVGEEGGKEHKVQCEPVLVNKKSDEKVRMELAQVVEGLTPVGVDRFLTLNRSADGLSWECIVYSVKKTKMDKENYRFPIPASKEEGPLRHVVCGDTLLVLGGDKDSNWLLKEDKAVRLYTKSFFDEERKRLKLLNVYASAARTYYHLEGDLLVEMEPPKGELVLGGPVFEIAISGKGKVGTLVRCGDTKIDVVTYCKGRNTVSRLKEPVEMSLAEIKWDNHQKVFKVRSDKKEQEEEKWYRAEELGPEMIVLVKTSPSGNDDVDPPAVLSCPDQEYKERTQTCDQLVYEDTNPPADDVATIRNGPHQAWIERPPQQQQQALVVKTGDVTKVLLKADFINTVQLLYDNLVAVVGGNVYFWGWKCSINAQYGYTPAGSTGEWYVNKRLTDNKIVKVAAPCHEEVQARTNQPSRANRTNS